MNGSPSTNTTQWWLKKNESDRADIICRVTKRIFDAQDYHRDQLKRGARLYGDTQMAGLSPQSYARRATSKNGGKVSFNVTKSCSDAYVAKVTKDKPKVSFVTSGGDDRLKQKAQGLERFCDGQFYELGFYNVAPLFALDTCWAGNGFAKFYIAGTGKAKRIAMDRVLPVEMHTDDAEAVNGAPRSIYQTKYVDRGVLKAQAKQWKGAKYDSEDIEDAIDKAPRNEHPEDSGSSDSLADQILVREAWHLPSDEGAGDGRHSIAIVGALLFDEPWTRMDFPFAVLRRRMPLIGWWDTSLSRELEGIQRELNVLLFKVQRHYHLLGAAHWSFQKGSINKSKLTNDIDHVEWTGIEPKIVAPVSLISPEVYQHIDRLYSKAYELSGVSQMSAQSQIPQQVESGKAIQALADVESDRFMTNYRMYEAFVLDCVKQILTLARQISESNPDYAVRAFSERGMVKTVFAEHWLEENEYILKMYPTNLLADDPSAKMAQVEKFMNAGMMDPDDAMRLLDFPDMQAAQSIKQANYNATQRIVAGILERGEYIGPDPLMQLEQSIGIVRAAYQGTIGVTGLDEERVEMLRRWLVQASDLKKIGEPPPAPPMMPPAGPMPPPGMPPPPDPNAAPVPMAA
jgi:hypothetical protein